MAIFNSELLVITRGYPHYPMVRPVGRLVEGQLRLRTEQPLLQRRAGGAPVCGASLVDVPKMGP